MPYIQLHAKRLQQLNFHAVEPLTNYRRTSTELKDVINFFKLKSISDKQSLSKTPSVDLIKSNPPSIDIISYVTTPMWLTKILFFIFKMQMTRILSWQFLDRWLQFKMCIFESIAGITSVNPRFIWCISSLNLTVNGSRMWPCILQGSFMKKSIYPVRLSKS